MASDLNAGFSNNINIIAIRTSGSSSQIVTDRAIDFDGDGNKEVVSVTPGTPTGGNTFNPPPTFSAEANSSIPGSNQGVARSVVQRIIETDGGVDTSGSEFTEGLE